MPEVRIPISLTAAQLNASGASPITLYSYTEDTRFRIPTRIELVKEAGTTAYGITVTGESSSAKPYDDELSKNSYTAFFGGGAFLTLEAQDANGVGRVLAYIPENGFLDVATEQKRLVFPSAEGLVFRPGVTTYVLRSTAALASGDARIRGFIYFNEYAIGSY